MAENAVFEPRSLNEKYVPEANPVVQGKTFKFTVSGHVQRLEAYGVKEGRALVLTVARHKVRIFKKSGSVIAKNKKEADGIRKALQMEVASLGIRLGAIEKEKELYSPVQEYLVSIIADAQIETFGVENTSPPSWTMVGEDASMQAIAKGGKTILKGLRMTSETISSATAALDGMGVSYDVVSKQPGRVPMFIEPIDVDALATNLRLSGINVDYDVDAMNPLLEVPLSKGGFVQVIGGRNLQFYGPEAMAYALKYAESPGEQFFFDNGKTN